MVSFTIYAQDPHESDDIGWSDAGHYVTGCSKDWISLRLVDENGDLVEVEEEGSTDEKAGTSAASITNSNDIYGFVSTLAFAYVLKNLIA